MKLGTWRLYGVCAFAVASASGNPQTQTPFSVQSRPKLAAPSRPLQWGDINVISTTDTHGWLLGHQKESSPEPNYSGTWGDYAAFVTHMKKLAEEKDVDLLLVDSGDMHDGTGLSDGFPPGSVDARDSGEFFKQIPYDVLAIGNHELYKYANTFDMHTNFGRHYEGRYLSSNVNITVFDENNQTTSVPVGSRFRKFKTRKGRTVTAFGVLYDFTTNDVNTTVQPVEDMVNEPWFTNAIKEEPDLFLLVGHMPVSRSSWPLVFDTIRKEHPTTPILIFGGHLHIRDCVQLDDRSMSLASGRYMETLGWMSVDLDEGGSGTLNFSRRYLDTNSITYKYHTGTSDETFYTDEGKNITDGLYDLEKRFGLTYQYGVAPRDYTMTRDPYPSNGSLLSLSAEEVMSTPSADSRSHSSKVVPFAISLNTTRAGIPFVLIISSGSQRFDIYKGPFTRNDQLTASPFVNRYIFIPDVPFEAATKVLPTLNADGPERVWGGGEGEMSAEEARQLRIWKQEREIEEVYRDWLEDMHRRHAVSTSATQSELTLGYVTTDSCPGLGDDVPHTPIPVYPIPPFIASRTPDASNTVIDIVFDDFFEEQIIRTLNKVQNARVYTRSDTAEYSPVRSNEVLGLYAEVAWNQSR
ncbi:Metallo-dependent phosphatase-like protein [Mycena amicta]|nr:Metallo-dependent phosphatase-like protein [Mycena amicta]